MPANGSTVVIPATALQTSQQGNSVYIVRPGDTVDFVTVDVARTVNNTAAITSGLKQGDVVVTDGQLQLTPGAKVSVQQGVASPSGNAGAPPSESSAVGN
jgi:multidrug efflux system membrane fusion protein